MQQHNIKICFLLFFEIKKNKEEKVQNKKKRKEGRDKAEKKKFPPFFFLTQHSNLSLSLKIQPNYSSFHTSPYFPEDTL